MVVWSDPDGGTIWALTVEVGGVLGFQFVGEFQLSLGELDAGGCQTTVVGEEEVVVVVGGITICWVGVVTGVLTIAVTGLAVALVVTVLVTTAAVATAVEELF